MFKGPIIHSQQSISLQEIIKEVRIFNLVYNLLNLIIISTVYLASEKVHKTALVVLKKYNTYDTLRMSESARLQEHINHIEKQVHQQFS